MSGSKGEIARRRILQAIVEFTSINQHPPTIWDLKDITGIRSYQNIWRHLNKLRQQRWILWHEQDSTVEITEIGLTQLIEEGNLAEPI